jgi:L-threonylcarbamoyladenylate synthase
VSYITDSFDDKIVESLRNGGVGLLPTDTIYGLSCRALDQAAVERIHSLKDRQDHKPFIVLISDIKMLERLSISQKQAKLVIKHWPGGLSVVFSDPNAPTWLQFGSQTLAVRLPSNSSLQKLINKTGPIISTSANLSGLEPAKSIQEAESIFGSGLDFYVDAGILDNPPSTLAEINKGQLKVLRQGAVRLDGR